MIRYINQSLQTDVEVNDVYRNNYRVFRKLRLSEK